MASVLDTTSGLRRYHFIIPSDSESINDADGKQSLLAKEEASGSTFSYAAFIVRQVVSEIIDNVFKHQDSLSCAPFEFSISSLFSSVSEISEEDFFEQNYQQILLQENQYLLSTAHRLPEGAIQFSQLIGRGGFGEVYKGVFTPRGIHNPILVAIKVNRLFEKFKKNASVLSSLQNEALIYKEIGLKDQKFDVFSKHIASGFLSQRRFCIIQEFYPISLFNVMQKKRFIGLSFEKVFYFTEHLLQALVKMQTPDLGYLHTDLKPENIVLTNILDYKVKFIDLGCMQKAENLPSKYKGTRNFSPPEVILNMPVGFSLDIWSLGCLFFELYTGDRLFKAKTDHDFLLMVEELLGPVNKSYIEKSSRFEELFEASSTEEVYHLKQKFADFPFKNTKEHFDKALMQAKKHAMSLLHPFKIRNFLEMESDFKEMLFSMLKWDASQRSSATDLLHHPFMEKMRLFLSDRSNHASAFKPYCSAIAISSAVQAAPQSFSLKTLIELKPTLEEKF